MSRLVGHARASMSLDVYGHVLVDEAEIDYEGVLSDKLGARYDRAVHTAVTPSETKTAD